MYNSPADQISFQDIIERLDRIIALLETQNTARTAAIVQATLAECMTVIQEAQATPDLQSGPSLAAQGN